MMHLYNQGDSRYIFSWPYSSKQGQRWQQPIQNSTLQQLIRYQTPLPLWHEEPFSDAVLFCETVDILQTLVDQMFGVKRLGFQTAGQGASNFPEITFQGLENADKPKEITLKMIEKTSH